MLPEELDLLFDVVLVKRRLFTEALCEASKRRNAMLQTDIGYELVKRKIYDFDEKRAIS